MTEYRYYRDYTTHIITHYPSTAYPNHRGQPPEHILVTRIDIRTLSYTFYHIIYVPSGWCVYNNTRRHHHSTDDHRQRSMHACISYICDSDRRRRGSRVPPYPHPCHYMCTAAIVCRRVWREGGLGFIMCVYVTRGGGDRHLATLVVLFLQSCHE